MDRVDGARDGLADGGVARPYIFVADGTARKQMKLATRVLGSDHPITLHFQWGYARAFTLDKDVSAEQLAEVATTLEKTLKTAQRVLGREHPDTLNIRGELAFARKQIAYRQGAY